jgi:hypothetical protein
MPRVKHFHIEGPQDALGAVNYEVELTPANVTIRTRSAYGKRDVYRGRRGQLWLRYQHGYAPIPVTDPQVEAFLDELAMRAGA